MTKDSNFTFLYYFQNCDCPVPQDTFLKTMIPTSFDPITNRHTHKQNKPMN